MTYAYFIVPAGLPSTKALMQTTYLPKAIQYAVQLHAETGEHFSVLRIENLYDTNALEVAEAQERREAEARNILSDGVLTV